ncbi:MAG: hypothetical protein HY308_12510 [Gammaproteobacteria bacterium]|nr:hypothetical protein [Gammaproteobacteria bacterium]
MKTKTTKNSLGVIGVILGMIALGVALVHSWVGPIGPKPSLEEVVAQKAEQLRDSVAAILNGEDPKVSRPVSVDRAVTIATVIAGFLAIVFAVVSFIRREDKRVCGSAALLGGAALVVQYLLFSPH